MELNRKITFVSEKLCLSQFGWRELARLLNLDYSYSNKQSIITMNEVLISPYLKEPHEQRRGYIIINL